LIEGAVEVEEPNDRQVNIAKARHMAGATAVEVMKLIFDRRLAWKGAWADVPTSMPSFSMSTNVDRRQMIDPLDLDRSKT
jgi:hypothetical protein